MSLKSEAMDATCTAAPAAEEAETAETSKVMDLTYADAALETLLPISDLENTARGKPT